MLNYTNNSNVINIREPFKWCITDVQFFHPVKSFTASLLVARSADYSKFPNIHTTLLGSEVNPRAQYFL